MKHLWSLIFLLVFAIPTSAQTYFPPLTGNVWEKTKPQEFMVNEGYTNTLLQFLDDKNSKAFIVLYDGKIVLEHYFDQFTADSVWYWASAGKSLTAFLMGMAKDRGQLDLDKPVSDYLGQGWTSCTPEQELNIKVKHQMSMTTGLDEAPLDDNCTLPSCLNYKADAGTRWYYYNAPYLLTHKVMEAATGIGYNQFTNLQLGTKTGITGLWLDGVFYSKPRNAARFGLLMMSKGIWNGDTLLRDQVFYNQMINPTQQLNPSYGYLWWLNGQSAFMLPTSSLRLPGSLFTQAPSDLYAALGKNDQKIYIWPSKKMVVVRMGEESGTPALGPSAFDNELWLHIQEWIKVGTGAVGDLNEESAFFYPQPAKNELSIPDGFEPIEVRNLNGKAMTFTREEGKISWQNWPAGVYSILFGNKEGLLKSRKVMVIE